MINKTQTNNSSGTLKLGFVPLTDCAPLVMARELGLFRKHGLNVVLSRELGWATVRDKIIHRELDAAHAVAGMPFAATLGLGSIQCDCLSALVLSSHGNAITLSNDLWDCGVRDGAGLRAEIQKTRGKRVFTFGVVYPFSTHHFLLRSWLARAGILPDRDVRIVVVPPPQMAANLKAGHLDGFCAGEPWNSVAVQARAGWTIAASAELDPGHPEKVLMVRREFAEKRNEEHLALIVPLLEACRFCDAPENHAYIATTLSRREYVGVDKTVILRGLSGNFDFGHDLARIVPDFTIFSKDDANEPSGKKAAWIIQNLRDSGLCKNGNALDFALGKKVFRAEIFERALNTQSRSLKNETEKQIAFA